MVNQDETRTKIRKEALGPKNYQVQTHNTRHQGKIGRAQNQQKITARKTVLPRNACMLQSLSRASLRAHHNSVRVRAAAASSLVSPTFKVPFP